MAEGRVRAQARRRPAQRRRLGWAQGPSAPALALGALGLLLANWLPLQVHGIGLSQEHEVHT